MTTSPRALLADVVLTSFRAAPPYRGLDSAGRHLGEASANNLADRGIARPAGREVNRVNSSER